MIAGAAATAEATDGAVAAEDLAAADSEAAVAVAERDAAAVARASK